MVGVAREVMRELRREDQIPNGKYQTAEALIGWCGMGGRSGNQRARRPLEQAGHLTHPGFYYCVNCVFWEEDLLGGF